MSRSADEATVRRHRAVRAALGPAWQAFFGRFGRLHPVQLEAIPVLLAGRNAVIASATASGKTEAAMAPLAVRLLRARRTQPQAEVGVIWVTPTRALVNDIERRLAGPLASLGLELCVRTGDRPALRAGDRTDVLVTTPESLDSILCRHGRSWRGLTAVVLDELHLLDGTPRGDQLRVLAHRLRLAAGEPPPVFAALSATLPAPERTAARYFDDPVVVGQAQPGRRLDLQIVPSLEDAVAALRERKLHKVLWFANSRKEVEAVATQLRAGLWPASRVWVHHGSLSRSRRHEVEAALRRARWGICVATTTLEIGIDIGDIDAVVLSEPPPDAASLWQRAGRAGRRAARAVAIGIAHDEFDEAAYEEFAAGGVGAAGGANAPPRPHWSVAVQQVLSVLYQHRGGLERDELLDVLAPLGERATAAVIVDHLVARGHLVWRGRRLCLSTEAVDLGDEGRIHSNIAGERGLEIVDASSGKVLGGGVAVPNPGERFAFAGRTWEVVSRGRRRARVRAVAGRAGSGTFIKRDDAGAFATWLPASLRPAPRRES